MIGISIDDMHFYVHKDENGHFHVQNMVMNMMGQHHVHTETGYRKWAKNLSPKARKNIKFNPKVTKCDCNLSPAWMKDRTGSPYLNNRFGDLSDEELYDAEDCEVGSCDGQLIRLYQLNSSTYVYRCTKCGVEKHCNEDGGEICYHDFIYGRMHKMNKMWWERNPFTGDLDLVNERIDETYHDDGSYECDHCGDIDHKDFCYRAHPDWRPEKQIWIVDVTEEITRKSQMMVMADTEEEAHAIIKHPMEHIGAMKQRHGKPTDNVKSVSTDKAEKHTPWIIEDRQRQLEKEQGETDE